MSRNVVIDSGPLVSLFDRDARDHELTVDFIEHFDAYFHTTLAVVTETTHLLNFSSKVQQDFLRWVQRSVTRIPLSDDDFVRSIELHAKYADRPMDFADATLVAIAENLRIHEVVTIDTDFRFYRLKDRRFFTVHLLDRIESRR